jgi:hypothetical protein
VSYEEREATIERLRSLNGVMERALMIAGDALAENVNDLTSHEWFERLLRKAARELQDHEVFGGRWSLFSDEEIADLFEAISGDGDGGPIEHEFNEEYARRGLHPVG